MTRRRRPSSAPKLPIYSIPQCSTIKNAHRVYRALAMYIHEPPPHPGHQLAPASVQGLALALGPDLALALGRVLAVLLALNSRD